MGRTSNLCWLLSSGPQAAPLAADVCLMSYGLCRPLLERTLSQLLSAAGYPEPPGDDYRPGRLYKSLSETIAEAKARRSGVSRRAVSEEAGTEASYFLYVALVSVLELMGVTCTGK